MQIATLGWPQVQLTVAQVDRALEAYIMWLLGRVMFTSTHGNTVDERYIGVAREIADARRYGDIQQRSWGSAVLAATVRALCEACQRDSASSGLTGCPIFLHLWSFERFPIGRPDVDFGRRYEDDLYHGSNVDAPTFGTLWTRRQVSFN
jgi:hypothetical protein